MFSIRSQDAWDVFHSRDNGIQFSSVVSGFHSVDRYQWRKQNALFEQFEQDLHSEFFMNLVKGKILTMKRYQKLTIQLTIQQCFGKLLEFEFFVNYLLYIFASS